MNKTQKFIDKYFALYLSQCRTNHPFFEDEDHPNFPPTKEELEELMTYLIKNGREPVIIGSIATIKHLHITHADIQSRTYRLANKLELFLPHNLDKPLASWQVKKDSRGHIYWISPKNSVVELFNESNIFIGNNENKFHLEKDLESVDHGCPVADIATLFVIKLNNFGIRDLNDLLLLALKNGIPQNIDALLSNDKQKKNLTFIKKWVQNRSCPRS